MAAIPSPTCISPPPVLFPHLPRLQEWFAGAQSWVQPYAAFVFLKGLFGTAEHWTWGAMAHPTPELIQRLTSPQQEWYGSIGFCYWLQYQLHRQLKQVGALDCYVQRQPQHALWYACCTEHA
jgi:4-alpha-glucanotransferase